MNLQKNITKGAFLQKFFKTGPGDYGEGDEFLGLTVPQSRTIAKQFQYLSLDEIDELLSSRIHEERLIAVFILVALYKKADSTTKKKIFSFYLSHTNRINNWDIVDSSADKIVGEYLFHNPSQQRVLLKLARSEDLWERRIAMIATYQFLKYDDPKPTLEIAEILVNDSHDLIQKAVGWMLREMGKRCSVELLEDFLNNHCKTMPRTALRYSLEKLPEEKRKKYLSGNL